VKFAIFGAVSAASCRRLIGLIRRWRARVDRLLREFQTLLSSVKTNVKGRASKFSGGKYEEVGNSISFGFVPAGRELGFNGWHKSA
jgi:hypothetical protein